MKSQKQKILIVSAKWPYVTNSVDGGDSTLKEIIESIGDYYSVDLLCFRDDVADSIYVDKVERVMVYHDDFAMFKKYSLHNEEKFWVRLEQAEIAAEEIRKIHDKYDFIIVQHDMFILGLANDEMILKKMVLYPMFTGTSYVQSGELVPEDYLNAEKAALPSVKLIISPSTIEKEMLIGTYGVEEKKIIVIPRPVPDDYFANRISLQSGISMIYVASVRMQKNHMDAMKLLKVLNDNGMDARLECVGAIQDTSIYEECIEYLNYQGLRNRVSFSGSVMQSDVIGIMAKCNINISVSKWETFGRGIYEGMAYGLPTFVFDELACVKNADYIGIYPCFAKGINDMSEKILKLINDTDKYIEISKKGMELENKLRKEIIYGQVRKAFEEMFG